MTTNTTTPATTVPTTVGNVQPFQSASLYVGDLNPDVTEVCCHDFYVK